MVDQKKKPRLEIPESDYDSESDSGTDSSSDDSSHVSSLVRSSSLPSLASFAACNVANLNVFPFPVGGNTMSVPNVPQEGAPVLFNASTLNSNLNNVQSTSSSANIASGAFPTLPSALMGEGDDGEQLRASFRAACEEINRELDIIMQPLKTKQQTLKAIDSQQSEGAASNAPGPSSRSSFNSSAAGEANWLPPVNPFTSSVTLRQHLEAASNYVRPRRMRPPPGFHPTPQYNDGQGTLGGGASGAGVVRPPPGFHGISSGNALGTPVPGYYGLLDEGVSPEQFVFTMVPPRQVPFSEIRQQHFLSQGLRGEPTPSGVQDPLGVHSTEIWRRYNNGSGVTNPSAGENGAGYLDDYLQKEVYDILNSDQDSELWLQFEEYQRVQFAPGSLRNGTSAFNSEVAGPSKYGPVGYMRPRAQYNRRCRSLDAFRFQYQFDTLVQMPRGNVDAQEVTRLSDRFQSASIAASNSAKNKPPRTSQPPQNRNAMLGALLLRRLKQQAANANIETNATMNVPASTAAAAANTTTTTTTASATFSNSVLNVTATLPPISISVDQVPCKYCMQNRLVTGIPTHVLYDSEGRTVCPVLRNKPCPICNKAGDEAHTVHDCPIRKQWGMDDDTPNKKST